MIKNYVVPIFIVLLCGWAIFRAEMSIYQTNVFVDYVLDFTKDNHKTVERTQDFHRRLDMVDTRLDIIEAKINRSGAMGDMPRKK